MELLPAPNDPCVLPLLQSLIVADVTPVPADEVKLTVREDSGMFTNAATSGVTLVAPLAAVARAAQVSWLRLALVLD